MISGARLTLLAVGALGLALAATGAAGAQATGQGQAGAGKIGPVNQHRLGEVTIHPPHRRPHPSFGVPPAKADAYAADAAKDEAWRQYRDSTPPMTAGTLERSKDYPGLRTYVPQ